MNTVWSSGLHTSVENVKAIVYQIWYTVIKQGYCNWLNAVLWEHDITAEIFETNL